jgi:hypothetical protein
MRIREKILASFIGMNGEAKAIFENLEWEEIGRKDAGFMMALADPPCSPERSRAPKRRPPAQNAAGGVS